MVKNLKQLRQKQNISQRELACAIGISQQSINKYENHNIEPDIETLISIANFFNTSVDYLIGNIPEDQNSSQKIEEDLLIAGYRKLDAKEKLCIKTLIHTYNDLK